MRIIPVLDLLDGQVVQAVRGERSRYGPVQSILVSTPEPISVARALEVEFKCDTIYIADLNAIQKRGDHSKMIHHLAQEIDASLWVDAGITDVDSALSVASKGADRVVVGSETLPSAKALQTIHEALPEDRLLFSLDVAAGRVLSDAPTFKGREPVWMAEFLAREGWSHVIILTLDRVGTGTEPDWVLLKDIRLQSPELKLIAGGGLRSPEGLRRAVDLELDGILVATALHRGWITRAELQELGFGRKAPDT